MKIEILKSIVGKHKEQPFSFNAGEVVDVNEELGKSLINGKHAKKKSSNSTKQVNK